MSNKISACLVIYNEEKHIQRCLDSLRDKVDEIIIVMDGGSTDNTYEICKKYTDNIYILEHIGIGDYHLAFAFKKASYDWILKLDADEFLSRGFRDNIKHLVKDENVAGYRFLWLLNDGKKYITKTQPYKLALFNKNKISYLGVPHGKYYFNGSVITKDFRLEHYCGYNRWMINKFIEKQIPWIRLHARLLVGKFEDIPKFRIKGTAWDWRDRLRRKYCYLFIFFGVFVFFRNAIRGEWWNIRALKASFFNGLYEAMLNYYILKYKLTWLS